MSERPIKASEVMSLNRHERRHLGKHNGVKIPGVRKPIKNESNNLPKKK